MRLTITIADVELAMHSKLSDLSGFADVDIEKPNDIEVIMC